MKPHKKRELRVRFRQYTDSDGIPIQFSSSQPWCDIPIKKIRFLDQTLETVRYYGNDLEADDQDARRMPREMSKVNLGPGTLASASIVTNTSRITGNEVPANGSTASPLHQVSLAENSTQSSTSPSQLWAVQEGGAGLEGIDHAHSIFSGEEHYPSPHSVSIFRALPFPEIPPATLNDGAKADLFRHFIKDLWPAFDPCDPAQTVAAELLSDSVLTAEILELILSVSTWHMRKNATTNDSPPATSPSRTVISMWGLAKFRLDSEALSELLDENWKALFSLLNSLLFNISGLPRNEESSRRLHDWFPFVQLHSLPIVPDPPNKLYVSVFWAAMRQEAFLAVVHQAPVGITSTWTNLESLARGNDDHTWGNKMLLCLLEAIEFCFGEEKNTKTYDKLLDVIATWMHARPPSRTSLMLQKKKPGQHFPEIWLVNDCIAAGLQYYHLARILLIIYDPRIPRLSVAHKAATRWINDQVKHDLEIICGIAESMQTLNPAHLVACMAISLVGDRYTENDEQSTLLSILKRISRQYGWSTALIQQNLSIAWGRSDPEL